MQKPVKNKSITLANKFYLKLLKNSLCLYS